MTLWKFVTDLLFDSYHSEHQAMVDLANERVPRYIQELEQYLKDNAPSKESKASFCEGYDCGGREALNFVKGKAASLSNNTPSEVR